MQPIEKLKRGVYEWLVDHELDHDTRFYTSEEWRARDEPYLTDAGLILIFEGAFYSVVNGHTNSSKLYTEFNKFVEGFGYFFEIGNAWNMGFYPVKNNSLHPDRRENQAAEKLYSMTSASDFRLRIYSGDSS
jgi:hypothetical protein